MGHQLDDAMTTASKYIDGVPKFSHRDPILDTCSTCIQAMQTKNAATSTTLKATRSFRGFSMDFAFAVRLTHIDRKSVVCQPKALG